MGEKSNLEIMAEIQKEFVSFVNLLEETENYNSFLEEFNLKLDYLETYLEKDLDFKKYRFFLLKIEYIFELINMNFNSLPETSIMGSFKYKFSSLRNNIYNHVGFISLNLIENFKISFDLENLLFTENFNNNILLLEVLVKKTLYDSFYNNINLFSLYLKEISNENLTSEKDIIIETNYGIAARRRNYNSSDLNKSKDIIRDINRYFNIFRRDINEKSDSISVVSFLNFKCQEILANISHLSNLDDRGHIRRQSRELGHSLTLIFDKFKSQNSNFLVSNQLEENSILKDQISDLKSQLNIISKKKSDSLVDAFVKIETKLKFEEKVWLGIIVSSFSILFFIFFINISLLITDYRLLSSFGLVTFSILYFEVSNYTKIKNLRLENDNKIGVAEGYLGVLGYYDKDNINVFLKDISKVLFCKVKHFKEKGLPIDIISTLLENNSSKDVKKMLDLLEKNRK